MPTIPIYGQQVAPDVAAAQPTATPDAFGAKVWAATGQIEDNIVDARVTAAKQAKVIEARRAKDDAAADAAVTVSRNEAATDATVQAAQNAPDFDPATHVDKVLGDFDARAAAIMGGITDHDAANQTRKALAAQRAQVEITQRGFVVKASADKLSRDTGSAFDTYANQLNDNPTMGGLNNALNAVKAHIDELAVPPTVRDKLWDEARHRIGLSAAQGFVDKYPYLALQLFDGGQFDGLIDADHLAGVRHQAETAIHGIEAERAQAARQAEAEARRAAADARRDRRDAERDVADRVRDGRDVLRDGGTLPAGAVGGLVTAAQRAGRPELAREVLHLGTVSAVNTGLRGHSPAEVAGAIDALQTRVNAAGDNATSSDRIALKAAYEYRDTLLHDVATDPLGRAAKDGVINLSPVDPANPASIAKRAADATATANRYGRPVAPLTPDEVATIRPTITSGSPQQQLTALQQLSGFGGYRSAAVRQVTAGDPFHAHVGLLLGTASGASTARDALTGAPIAAAHPEIFTGGDRSSVLGDYVGLALSALPDLQASLPKVADALYATRQQRAGGHAWDAKAYQANVNAALGAVTDPSGTVRGGLGWHGNDRVLLPTGVSQAEFEAAAATVPSHATYGNGQPVPDDVLRAAPMRPVGDGRYQYVADPRTGAVFAMKNGQPFTVTIGHKPPVPR